MERDRDTIAAIATPLGHSALAVVRLSGPDTETIVRRIFRMGKNRRSEYTLRERYVHYGFVVDPETEEPVDEVTLILYRGPKSYTTEDMAEILCHGGFISPTRVLRACIKAGARQAEPGEFTKRAFLGGRIDLTEAEAVLDIIHASSPKEQAVALKQLSGGLRRAIEEVKERLTRCLMLVEASIDFPEEEIEFLDPEQLREELSEAKARAEELASHFEEAQVIRRGIPIAIVGRPNVGKSSLLNALLRQERAIVTSIPGTTRDTIEEELHILGFPFRLIDTAGIRETEDPVEKIGVERSVEKLKEASLVLMVIDASTPLTSEDRHIASLVAERPHVVVLNKEDLGCRVSEEDVRELGLKGPVVKTSCREMTGIDTLQRTVVEVLRLNRFRDSEFLINERHYGSLKAAAEALSRCLETLDMGLSNEFVAIDLKEALNRLGEITGEVTTDDILNMIFERFCIGK